MKLSIQTQAAFVTAAILALVALLAFFDFAVPAKANVITQGIVPHVSADQTVDVGPQATITLAPAASNCASRAISTASTSLMLSFSSSLTPSANVGHWQAASTTVSYDNGNFGCGPITAYSPASSTVAVTQLVQ